MKKLTLILGALSMVLLSSQSWGCYKVAGVMICPEDVGKEPLIIVGGKGGTWCRIGEKCGKNK